MVSPCYFASRCVQVSFEIENLPLKIVDLAQYLIPAAAGLISGVIGSLVAPWLQWGIEARREQSKARRELLVNARTVLADPPQAADFRKLPLYFQLRPLLSPKTIEAIAGIFDERGNEVIRIVRGGGYGGVNPYAHLVLDDLSQKEKEWGLL